MTSSNVNVLHPASHPLDGYLRVGHTGHHKLEALHAADRPAFDRLVSSRPAEGFLLRQRDPAVRSTRQASKLKCGDQRVQKLVVDAKSRMTRLCDALHTLHEADGAAAPVAAVPLFRGNRSAAGGLSVIQGGRP